ncbi:hypothetical protein A3A95_02630 [Candidatus Nomurabacteria bacterium RIFCSPLOWO2_01_FULL_39_18]|uniref:Coenzyme F420:L-glutamate ligase-like domain-containing protein n=1 Tax=Candidatus Nomurabacteria bacterium RIFCSPHIGHO2_01_FULL_40_24b TaxID=1801739 RepID=A0A1F6V719_9BACT|nr:MAG: hypothetical protein A2647_01090 [Candidatus Nomurabacteria bacterium RIFCSPHIGHO2_01_FULL_40_24b]OGI90754.1 MAG: hypothetical protein A3A95_02630 [Candidatus Nomurabacteria bacterium RIFCSPLOWO2_01_FULL_39_18]
MEIKTARTSIFRENENLPEFIFKHIKKIPDKSILVVTSKIVALSEGRTVVHRNEKQKIALIKQESTLAIKTKNTWFTIKDGMVMAASGIDESNGNGKLMLLPKDSFKSAEFLRKKLAQKFRLKNLGVLITDSGFLPFRMGAIGLALGYAGFKGVRNYIGRKDIFGRILRFSRTDVADSLATAAVLSTGEGDERTPLAIITGAPVVFTNKINKKELRIKASKDIYAPLFNKLN